MYTLQVELPQSVLEFIERQISSGRFESPSAYFHALIEADRQLQEWNRLEELVREGLNSGDPIPVTPEYWEEKKRRLQKRLAEAAKP
jgi:antitoxin ParD1/3/4